MKRLACCLGTGAMVLAALAGCGSESGKSGAQAHQMPPAPVLVAQSKLADVPVTLSSIGQVIPTNTVTVQPRVGGLVIKSLVHDGQEVKAGEVLFQIDPSNYQAALQQAQAMVTQSQANLKLAQLNADRARMLYEKKIGPEQDYDTARYTAEAQIGALAAAQAQLEQAKLNLSYTSITAPISGRAGAVLVDAGNVVATNGPNNQSNLLVINQLEPIDVSFSVPEQNYDAVMAAFHGSEPVPVRVDINGNPGHPQTGRLVFVDNQVDSATGTLGLKARFDNPDHLLWPGQFVTVTLVVSHHPDTVVVPSQAVQVNQDGTYVFVVDQGNTAQMQPVKTGVDVGSMTAILSGLKPDQTVVTDGMELRLFPGAKVAIKSSLQDAVNEVIGGQPATSAASAPGPASAAPAEKAATRAAPSEVK